MTAADYLPAELEKQAKPTPALTRSRGLELHNCPAETDCRGRAEQLPSRVSSAVKRPGALTVTGGVGYKMGSGPTASGSSNKNQNKQTKAVVATSQVVAVMTVAKASYTNCCSEGQRHPKLRPLSCKVSYLERLRNPQEP